MIWGGGAGTARLRGAKSRGGHPLLGERAEGVIYPETIFGHFWVTDGTKMLKNRANKLSGTILGTFRYFLLLLPFLDDFGYFFLVNRIIFERVGVVPLFCPKRWGAL
jgi:hypothetical protein